MDTVRVYGGLAVTSRQVGYTTKLRSGSSTATSGPDHRQQTEGARSFDALLSVTREGSVKVRLYGSDLLEANPGEIVTARFMVTNTSRDKIVLREVVNHPGDWSRVAATDPTFTLAPSVTAVRLVTFHIPPNWPAGTYDFLYEVMDPAAPAVNGDTSFRIRVLPQLDLGASIVRAPRVAVAGSEFTLELSFRNRGNTFAIATVRAVTRPNYKVNVEPVELLIPAGAAKVVQIGVRTTADLMHKQMCMVTVEAMVSEEEGHTTRLKEVVMVELIPRVTRLSDPYYRLPSWVKLTVAADGENAAIQAEVSGKGSIGGDRRNDLSYAVRQASRPDIGRYTSWDEYWLTYRGHHLEVNLGDRAFMLSPLVQRSYYGRGAGANIWVREVALGAYHAESRSDEPQHRETGGYISLQVKPGISVKANVLEKQDPSYVSSAGSKHMIASVQADYIPTPNGRLELEYGVDADDAAGNDGYRFATNGVFRKRFYFSLEKVRAGPRFHGYTTDSDLTLATFQYTVKPEVTLRFSYRRYDQNLDRNPLKLYASNERQVSAGVSYVATLRTRLNIDFQDFSRWDALEFPDYDFGERTIRASVGYSLPHLSLYLSGEHGYSHNDLVDLRTSLGRYYMSASIRRGAKQSYNIYAGFGNSKYSEVPRKSDDLGIAGRWHVTHNLDMSLDCHMSGSPSLVENMHRILTYSIDYKLPNRHLVTLRTSVWHARGGRRGDAAVLLTYSVPAPIPLGRNETVGTIKGRVYDAEDLRHGGIPDVIITADGAVAVSNSKGEFEFPSLKPGAYSLQVDAKSIGLGRVTEGRSPFVLVVEGGKTATIRIGVVRSCAISGDVLMFGFDPDGALPDSGETDSHVESLAPGPGEQSPQATASDTEEVGPVLVGLGRGRGLPQGARGLPGVLVEVSNGEVCMTQYTKSRGTFGFAGLRPGSWTVRIFPEDLPHYYSVQTDESHVDLAPGDETHMVLRILPRHRHINIMDEGEIKLERR
jgi:hypothetical protein